MAVTVRFSGRGTNLNGSRTQLQLPARNDTADEESDRTAGAEDDPDATDEQRGESAPARLVLAGLLGSAVVLGGIALVVLQRGAERDGDSAASASDDDSGGKSGPNPDRTDSPDPVGLVKGVIADGEYDRASRELYALVRASLADRADVANGGTHWEFYDAVASAPETDGDARKALRTVTETYEQAAFAPATVAEGRARAALAAGEQLLERGSG
jgi:hypothetical protein